MMPSRSLLSQLLNIAFNGVTRARAGHVPATTLSRRVHTRESSTELVSQPQASFEPKADHYARIDLNPFAKPDDETQKAFLDDLNPPLKKSFNLAAYVNSSKTLQELLKLGVSLYDIENININAARKLVLLDFERDCAPYVKFLVDSGLKPKNLGRFISEFPTVFQVPLGDLQIRVKYLKIKGFSKVQIANALNRSSRILVENIKSLDYKLGAFQVEFKLGGPLVRSIVSKNPALVSLPEEQYKLVNFTLTEEFGFSPREIHMLLKEQPKMLDMLRPVLIERLDLIHNIVGLQHRDMLKFPKLITGPKFDIRHRFLYLKKLKRNQFDPRQPLYVPPSALYNGSDEKFCQTYAKTSLEDYKLFLKSL